MKRMAVIVTLLSCVWALPVLAASWSMQCPPGWTDERSGLGDDLVKQCIAPTQDAFVELYASQGEVLPLEGLLQEWETEMLSRGLPFQSRLKQQATTVTGVPALVREYTGMANGARFHSVVAGMVNSGRTYVLQALYVEDRAALVSQVRMALDSFVFTNGSGGGCAAQQGGAWQPGREQPGTVSGGGGSATAGAGTQVPGLVDRAWKTGGNMSAKWGDAHGSVEPGKDYSVWELTTTRSVGLHFRDPYKKGKQTYHVDIVDKPSGKYVARETVGMFSKIRVGPGHFIITVRPASAYAGWSCDWE